ncbi:hypothetical protein EGW08_018931 [Elysia chlorotica]|uniref:LolA-like domain-containing protein n=1 Tax=Elysia chlorotica TaxID=188477 RepID=A0A433SVJ8_ELYCH|nr:hypothetical protein EGW08_018931 [Elysia chlorotica]
MSVRSLRVLVVLLVASPLFRTALTDEAQDKKDICGDIKSNVVADTEFDFQTQFKVHIESVMPDKGRIANSWLYFSPARKMLKATLKSPGMDYELYDDYDQHQTLVYNLGDAKRGSCQVYPFMTQRLGFYLLPSAPDAGLTPTVSEVLRLSGKSGFGSEQIQLMKSSNTKQMFRSLNVQQYDSCQKITAYDGSVAIVKVTHLVSKTKLARTESGTVPIQTVINGKFVSDKDGNVVNLPITHTFNFFHYSTSVTEDDFLTPEGIVCPNRKGPNNFPKPPLYISFGQEVHDTTSGQVITVKTTYDKEFNFVTDEFFDPTPGRQSTFRFDDFYAGLSYQIDHNTGACIATNISENDNVNNYKIVQGGKLQMMTPEQFWDAEGVKYHYNGKKHFRGLETESWIGKDESTGYMYEWYFTFGIEHTMNDMAKSEQKDPHRIPYKRIFWPDDTDNYFSNYYFQVDFTEPALLLDLSPCYQNQRQFISLFVAGLALERVEKDETLILRRAVTTLTQKLNIPFTRIANPQIAFKGSKGYILFEILGTPKYSSDLVTQHTNQPSLDEVIATLKKLTKDRKLVFDVGNKDITVSAQAKYEEFAFKSPDRGGGGYSAGALAGLSLTMVVIGLAAGGGGGYWFFIRH